MVSRMAGGQRSAQWPQRRSQFDLSVLNSAEWRDAGTPADLENCGVRGGNPAVVFVDAFPVEIPSLMGSEWPTYRQLLDEPLPQFTNSPSFELVDIDRSVEQVAAARASPPVPTVVLTRPEPFAIPPPSRPSWARSWNRYGDATSDLIALRPRTPHLIATGSDHFIPLHQPGLVVAGVRVAMQRSVPKNWYALPAYLANDRSRKGSRMD
jgi:hypothetical protein